MITQKKWKPIKQLKLIEMQFSTKKESWLKCFLDQENGRKRKKLSSKLPIWSYLASIFYVTIWRNHSCVILVTWLFQWVTFSMSHVTCLNSTHGKSYNSTHNGLEKIVSNQFEAKLCPKSVQCNSIILGETNYELDFNLKWCIQQLVQVK